MNQTVGMATTTEEKVEFAERLKLALGRSRKRLSTPTALANAFNLRWQGAPVTAQAAQKWLQGTAMPAPDKIGVLAEMLGVPVQWLRYGIAATADTKATRLNEARARGYEGVQTGAVTAEELRLVERLRGMTEVRRELVKRLVAELALEQEMWLRN